MELKKKNEEQPYRSQDTGGNDYADMSGMSELHKAALDAAKKSWGDASAAGDRAGMDAAHRQAESIRALYGYSGGGDGSAYIPTASAKKAGAEDFSYRTAPAYVSKYQSAIDALTGQITGRKGFEYDPETDPAYRQYREQYTQAGKRAMEDTLGQVSARTGGLASTYAGSAAQQTYDQYMSALADKVPELRQLAYQMYAAEGDRQRSDLELLRALEQGDYGRYQDLLGQYNADRSFAYGQYRDAVGDRRYQQELDYQRDRDAISDQRYQQQMDYQLDRDAVSDRRYQQELDYQRGRDAVSDQRYQQQLNYQLDRDAISDRRYQQELDYQRGQDAASAAQQQRENDLAVAKLLASYGDFSGYKALGVDTSGMEAAWADQEEIEDVEIPKTDSAEDGGDSGTSDGTEPVTYDAMRPKAKELADRIYDMRKKASPGVSGNALENYYNGLAKEILLAMEEDDISVDEGYYLTKLIGR